MKKLLLLVAACCCLIALRAQDVSHVENQSTQWQTTFTSEKLDQKELEAFEKRAEQKLKDFYNYLEVISDPKFDKKMREDARKQALELFSGKNCTVSGVNIEKLLDSCLALTLKTKSYVVGSTTVKTKFPALPDVVGYSGALEFQLYTASSTATRKEASMMLIKTEKLFGSDKKQVWTVYLCGIK